MQNSDLHFDFNDMNVTSCTKIFPDILASISSFDSSYGHFCSMKERRVSDSVEQIAVDCIFFIIAL